MASFSGSNPTDSINTVCVFTTSGSFVPQFSGVVEVLVVAGGGGGGMDMGGGGGGGGVVSNSSVAVTAGVAVTVTVGAGGIGAPAAGTNGQPGGHQYTIPATNGGNSVFGSLTAIGGGFGGSSYRAYTPGIAGGSGGSGGGSSGFNDNAGTFFGGAGTAGQGFRGGNSTQAYYSGGGGGAGGQGADSTNQPNGGPGVANGILGVTYSWGGGGGGASYSLATGGHGGIGGGGGGALGTTTGGAGYNNGSPGGGGDAWSPYPNTPGGNAGANTGGGGGGGTHYNANNKGGDGGSGIVVVRFSTSLGSAAVGNATIINTDSTVLSLDAANIKSVPVFSAEVLVVAGGGSGAGGIGAGGGAGGVLQGFTALTSQTYTITVGAGGQPIIGGSSQTGAAGNNGSNSTALGMTAIGGGHGGRHRETNHNGAAGGSGGGAGANGERTGGAGTAGQGNRGGNSNSTSPNWTTGGGGGAGGQGQDVVGGQTRGGDGGIGIASSIEGNLIWYGGGGGGGVHSGSAGAGDGGLGGGGGGAASAGPAGLGAIGRSNGSNGASGGGTSGGSAGANTGGGGGGGAWDQTFGGAGGSGIVIIRYPGPQRATGGTVTTVGSDTVHTFTTSGTFAPINTWTDLSNFGNNGTLINGVGYNSVSGGSLVFDRASSHNMSTNLPITTTPALSNFTYEIILNITSLPPASNNGVILGATYYAGAAIYWRTSGSTFNIRGFIRGADAYRTTAEYTLSLNTVYHVVMTNNYSAGTLNLYVNGILFSSTATATQEYNPSLTPGLNIGINQPQIDGGGSETYTYFTGKVHSAKVHVRTLTATEVQQNFNATKARYTGYQTITYTATANMTLTNNGTQDVTMFKTSDNNSWNGEVRSTEAFSAPCTIEFSKQAASGDNGVSYVMIGWNQDPTTDTSYSSIDHASYPYRADVYSVYNNGSQVHFSGAWDVNKRFYIVYDTDGFVRHYNGSTLLYSANYGTNRTVFVDSSFYSVNSTFGGLTAVKVARSSWNGTNYV